MTLSARSPRDPNPTAANGRNYVVVPQTFCGAEGTPFFAADWAAAFPYVFSISTSFSIAYVRSLVVFEKLYVELRRIRTISEE